MGVVLATIGVVSLLAGFGHVRPADDGSIGYRMLAEDGESQTDATARVTETAMARRPAMVSHPELRSILWVGAVGSVLLLAVVAGMLMRAKELAYRLAETQRRQAAIVD